MPGVKVPSSRWPMVEVTLARPSSTSTCGRRKVIVSNMGSCTRSHCLHRYRKYETKITEPIIIVYSEEYSYLPRLVMLNNDMKPNYVEIG